MRVAIFGSWNPESQDLDSPLLGSFDQFVEACHAIGVRLAELGHSIVILSNEPKTADFHVMRGVIAYAKDKQVEYPLIDVVAMITVREALYSAEANMYPHLFTFSKAISQSWNIAHLMAYKTADAVLIIGGFGGSYRAGIAALIGGKRVVPIASFGGAGAKLLDDIDMIGMGLNVKALSQKEIGVLRGPWSEVQLTTAICALGLCEFPRIAIIHGRSQDWKALKDYLMNDLGLPEPVVMGEQFGQGRTLPEEWENLAAWVDGAIALATPDDMGAAMFTPEGMPLAEAEWQYAARARQNVWIEVGWIWGGLKRSRVLILTRGDVEIPSDLQGVKIYSYSEHPKEANDKIKAFVNLIRKGDFDF